MAKLFSFKKNRFLTFGVPFFVLIIGGSFGLTKFSEIRYQYRGQKRITPEEAKEMGVTMKPSKEVTIEKEFKKLQSIDIDTWENKRGPRPWEENNPTIKEMEERQIRIKNKQPPISSQ